MPRQVELILQRTEAMKAEDSAMFGYKLPLTGKDVMDIKGIGPGPQVKECLDYLLKLAFVNPLRDKEEFITQVSEVRKPLTVGTYSCICPPQQEVIFQNTSADKYKNMSLRWSGTQY